MNANELADELHKIYIQEAAECWDVVEEAATMLRQQQAEIEALKMDIHSLTYGERLAKHFNKPVAWYYENKNGVSWVSGTREQHDKNFVIVEKPIYTHPAKTLPDEEIDAIGMQALKDTASLTWGQDAIYEFARAILRKAQEK
jgi:hypothetical protein